MQIVKYITPTSNVTLAPIQGVTGQGWPGSLITSPMFYSHNGLVYDLTNPGLYTFVVPGVNTTNLIVFDGDVSLLIATIDYLIVPGQADETVSIPNLLSYLGNRRVSIMCTTSVLLTQALLNTLPNPPQHRLVRVLRSDTPNGFYDGHVLLEVRINSQWTLFDTNYGLYFNGSSLLDTCPALSTTSFSNLHNYKLLTSTSPHTNYVYHQASVYEALLSTQPELYSFQQSLMQIPCIQATDGLTYCYLPTGTESRLSWVQSLGYTVLSKSAFIALFYHA